MKAIYDLMGARFYHGKGDGFDETAAAHGAVHAAGFGTQVIPIIDFGPNAPGGAAEGAEAVVVEAVDIDFASETVEADGFVAGGFNVHAPEVTS